MPGYRLMLKAKQLAGIYTVAFSADARDSSSRVPCKQPKIPDVANACHCCPFFPSHLISPKVSARCSNTSHGLFFLSVLSQPQPCLLAKGEEKNEGRIKSLFPLLGQDTSRICPLVTFFSLINSLFTPRLLERQCKCLYTGQNPIVSGKPPGLLVRIQTNML